MGRESAPSFEDTKMSALKNQIVDITDQSILIELFRETANRIVALADNPLDGVDLVKEALLPEVNDLLDIQKSNAIEDGLAVYVTKNRESAPNKAKYIELHGEDAWKANCKTTTYQQWERIK